MNTNKTGTADDGASQEEPIFRSEAAKWCHEKALIFIYALIKDANGDAEAAEILKRTILEAAAMGSWTDIHMKKSAATLLNAWETAVSYSPSVHSASRMKTCLDLLQAAKAGPASAGNDRNWVLARIMTNVAYHASHRRPSEDLKRDWWKFLELASDLDAAVKTAIDEGMFKRIAQDAARELLMCMKGYPDIEQTQVLDTVQTRIARQLAASMIHGHFAIDYVRLAELIEAGAAKQDAK